MVIGKGRLVYFFVFSALRPASSITITIVAPFLAGGKLNFEAAFAGAGAGFGAGVGAGAALVLVAGFVLVAGASLLLAAGFLAGAGFVS